jgi:hypothetical protein
MSKTIAGLIVTILGMFGVAQIASDTEITRLIDLLMQAGGIVMAWYGRYRVGDINAMGKRKVAELE